MAWSDNAKILNQLRRLRRQNVQVLVRTIPLEEARALLVDSVKRHEPTPENYLARLLGNKVVAKINDAGGTTDRILLPADINNQLPEVSILKKAQAIINQQLKKQKVPCVARYDDLSQKFLVVAADKLGFYWGERRSGRVASRACNDMY